MFLCFPCESSYSSCSHERGETKPFAGHIFPTVYNVALYSTWEAQ
jgi:hypothetical protein